jgi:MFS family permease
MSSKAAGAVERMWPALGNRHFRLLWLGMLPSTLAWQMSVVASGYAALILSGSATALGLVASASGLPMLVLSPLGGVVADRFPRRRVLLATQCILGSSAVILATLALAGVLQVWHLVALGLAQGVAFSFNMPARQAYIAELLPSRLLGNAVALSNTGMNFNRIVGPALGGALLAVPAIGIGGVFALMAGLYGIVVSSLLRLPERSIEVEGKPRALGGVAEQLLEGLRYVRQSAALRTLLTMALVTLFFGMPYQQLMPLFSERVFDVGSVGLGTMMAANGLGALAGSLVVAALSSAPRQSALQIGFGTGYGLSLVGFALAPSFALALAALAFVGAMSSAYTTINSTLVMRNSEPRLHGRVMSIYLMTFAITPLATLPMAWLADQIGPRAAVAAAGAIVAGLVVGAAILHPLYRRIG